MNRAISGVFALFIGAFTLAFSLIVAIPLTIAALITGKKIQRNLKAQHEAYSQPAHASVLEGEYEDVSSRERSQ